MTERPILFSGAMVRAILEGRKTQTRRVVKLPPAPMHLGEWQPGTVGADPAENSTGVAIPHQGCIWHSRTGHSLLCPYGQPGDRLWVRETHAPRADCWGRWAESVAYERSVFGPGELCYAADGGDPFIEKWRPSIHMPRWACRLVLEVTGVRVERLQAISEDDALAEGIDTEGDDYLNGEGWKAAGSAISPERYAFASLWRRINGDASWDANPWVWVVEFRPLAAPTSPQGVDGG